MTVDLDRDRFVVRYARDRATTAELLAAVESAGYDARLVPVETTEHDDVPRLDLALLPSTVRECFDRAERAPSIVLLHFEGPGWVACIRMDTVTYPHPDVRQELRHWVPCHVDVSRHPDVAEAADVPAIPTTLAVAPDGRILSRMGGFIAPAAFVDWLEELRRTTDLDDPAPQGR